MASVRHRVSAFLAAALCTVCCLDNSSVHGQEKPAFQLQPGDHISILGNTLADRMQHDGWLETFIYSRFPKHDLVFRNLGFSADELTVRLRSAAFGSPDDWLRKTNTNVIFAFFGYNESFGGDKGLPKFKQDLDSFVKNTLKQKYAANPPRLVLFSPIAAENLKDPNLPDGTAINERLKKYTAAMAEVAMQNNVVFVDLFHPSLDLYAKSAGPLTINGVHLNEAGNEQIAKVIDESLFGKPAGKQQTAQLDKIRRAVVDKNFYWFNRYRTTDGYSIYGGRADLKFVNGQTNRVVMQREMEILDAMTANRDKRVWAVAQGRDLQVDDSNTPDFIPVTTNKPGSLPGGKHLFLDGEAAITKMTPGKNIKINLFASEKEFPELINPVQMAFDTKGRLWVATWPTYPHWKPKEPMNDRLVILEDTNGDGKADKATTFVDNLHNPTGFEFWNGGVLVAHAPDLLFLKDTDGDDKADVRIRVLSGLDSADTHHTANSFTLDPGGALYFQEGTFHHTQVETPWLPPQRCSNAGVFRYEPRAQKFDVYVNFGFANPHGHAFDRWGQDIVVDGTGAQPFHAALFSGQTDYPDRHGRPPQVYKQKTRPCPGIEYMSSRHFPDEMQGNLLVGNVIGFLGIMNYKMKDEGASFGAVEVEPILSATDPNFRPADFEIGPDGALYFVDWQNPIIGHMQHNLRDPSRDRAHGRVYRVTYEGRQLLEPAKIAGEPIEKLLDLLKSPENRTRYRTRIELSGRDSGEVIAATQKWITGLDKKDADYEHHMMEALWQHQSHNVINEGLLKRMLRSPDFHARAAATRVLCYWRDRVTEPLKLLQTQINDEHPRVRLEAIRALSFFHTEEAMAIALEMFAHPDDEYLRFTFNETLNTLERRVGAAKVDRKNIAVSLLKMLEGGKVTPERTATLIETVCRHGGPKELNQIWLRALQKDGYSPELREDVLDWLTEAATSRRVQPPATAAEVAQLLKDAQRPTLLASAVRLAAAWKMADAAGAIRQIAANGKLDQAARFAAIDALASLRDKESQGALAALTAAPAPLPIRYRAAAALSGIDLDASANAAAVALSQTTDMNDPSPLIEAFLLRKDGSDALAGSLAKQNISADTAKRILRAMYLAGRNDAALGNVAAKFAGLDASPKPPTAAEVRAIGAEVAAKGDAKRGEHVFRRADLGCIKCHAVNKAGGSIGPDLGPIGGTSPVDYIVMSVLDPNQAIKEEYITKVVVTSQGQVITGVEVGRTKDQLTLKDATGKLIKIPMAEVEEEGKGKSLMPEGVTRILTQGELFDLIRFVSELGKPGEFAIPTTPAIRTWKRLKEVPVALREGVPNRDILRDTLLRYGLEGWDTMYGRVDGTLPLEELKSAPGVPVYLQGEIQVVQGGPIEISVQGGQPLAFWIDEDAFEKQGPTQVQLAPGRHRITVRLENGATGGLKVELRRPKDSRAHFEVVN